MSLGINSETQSATQTQAVTSVQQKKKTSNKNIVIEFSVLPKELKTKEIRKFYDKDGSGLLESNNWNNQNEVDLMAKAFGLDLSTYASKDIAKTVDDFGTRCYDANGNLTHVYNDTALWEAGNNTPYDKYDYKYTREYYEDDYSLKYEQKYGKNGSWEVIGYDKQGNTIKMTDLCKTAKIYDKDNNVIANVTSDVGKDDRSGSIIKIFNGNKVELVTGQNVLIKTQDVEIDGAPLYRYMYDGKNLDVESLLKNATYQKPVGESRYLFNGEEVNVKDLVKGIYEITTKNGEVKYIGYDGQEISPEKVRQMVGQ